MLALILSAAVAAPSVPEPVFYGPRSVVLRGLDAAIWIDTWLMTPAGVVRYKYARQDKDGNLHPIGRDSAVRFAEPLCRERGDLDCLAALKETK